MSSNELVMHTTNLGKLRPEDVLRRSQKRQGLLYLVLASMKVILLKWPPQNNRLTIRKEGI